MRGPSRGEVRFCLCSDWGPSRQSVRKQRGVISPDASGRDPARVSQCYGAARPRARDHEQSCSSALPACNFPHEAGGDRRWRSPAIATPGARGGLGHSGPKQRGRGHPGACDLARRIPSRAPRRHPRALHSPRPRVRRRAIAPFRGWDTPSVRPCPHRGRTGCRSRCRRGRRPRWSPACRYPSDRHPGSGTVDRRRPR
jgi:hypothetical protein